jgi:hypothetical protein
MGQPFLQLRKERIARGPQLQFPLRLRRRRYGIASHNAARSICIGKSLKAVARPQIEMGPADCAKT